jgi:two-component system cell cycle response regulator DivK
MSRPAKVLVVDDEPEIVSYLEDVLQDLGYETVNASNGAEAVERAIAAPPPVSCF